MKMRLHHAAGIDPPGVRYTVYWSRAACGSTVNASAFNNSVPRGANPPGRWLQDDVGVTLDMLAHREPV